ncbi:unnamed protein product [Linum trigynum]|uniref:Reverse transcriptase domain-containing protein n=1 Tax=Linum trigynum TaxID=586398 RepID=A0AAV2GMP3_9ROSI
MSREDEEKTAFMTPFGNFCFVGMPFGLKNTGATYQRMIDTVFSRQIGRNIEAYVDDLIVKTKPGNSHLEDLRETFEALREHNLRLNPLKCVFGAEAGKFLGFMITKRGIEVDPKKITAVQQLLAPRSALEIQSLNGKIAALGRFILRSADKCAPFFKTLKSGTKFALTKECEAAFQELKAYLVFPPVLTAPKLNEKLFLYLAVSTRAVSAVLISRRNDKAELPVYYTSRTLVSTETRYSPIEKAALALVSASQKLCPYFQAYQITVLTNLPLKKILTSMEVSGHMVKWAVELSEYDIQYAPRPAIKAQILADFIAERVTLETTPEEVWEVYVDGAASKHGAGAGVVVRTPTGAVHEIAIRLRALKTNNAAEYEAILTRMSAAHELGAKTIRVLSETTAPTYRITMYNEETNDEARLLDLELAQERRELATIKLAAMKEQVAKYHNKKLVPHKLILGDQVLRRNFRPDPKHGKLASAWEGPYLICEVVGANTFKLSELGGNKIQRTWNAQNLRKYHQAT